MSKNKGQALSGAAGFFIAAVPVLLFFFAACESPVDNGKNDITWTALADGEAGTAASTKIDFTFSGAVAELTAADITLTGNGGSVTGGSLTNTDAAHWSLGITVAAAGNVKVKIEKTGIETNEKNVAVYKEDPRPLVYTVSFDKNGGTADAEPSQISLTWPDNTVNDLPLPPSPPSGDLVFRGWNTSADGSGTRFTAATEISENITVYARWGAPFDSMLTDADDVAEYLSVQPGGAKNSPIALVLDIDLGDMTAGSPWYDLLDVLDGFAKYVALDLSDCTMTGTAGDGTVFRPLDAVQTGATTNDKTATYTGNGKSYIVELTLPLRAKKIRGGWTPSGSLEDVSAFLGFTNLINIRGDNIEGAYAETGFRKTAVFAGTSSLKEAYFEKLTDSDSFFWKCRNLEYVYCPGLTAIGTGTFYGCTNLKSFDFSNVQSIGKKAFGSTGLVTLDLGQSTVTEIPGEQRPSSGSTPNDTPLAAFNSCSNLETIIFPACLTSIDNYKYLANPELRGGRNFDGCNKIKEVTFLGDPAAIDWRPNGPPYETGLDDDLITLALSGENPEDRIGTYVKNDGTWSKKP